MSWYIGFTCTLTISDLSFSFFNTKNKILHFLNHRNVANDITS